MVLLSCGPSQPPSTPDFTSATIGATSVQLSWSAVSNVTSYLLERGSGATPTTWTGVLLSNSTATQVTDSGLNPSTTYSYRLKASNGAGSSFFASKILTTLAVPPAPAGFTATIASPTTVNLAWNPVAGATSYRLQRGSGADPSSFSDLALATPTATSFSDTSLTTGLTFTYRVQAVTAAGEGEFAKKTVTLTAAPTPPTGFTVKESTATSLKLGWNTVPGATKYDLERGNGTSPSLWSAMTLSSPTALEFNNTGLTVGSIYSYRLRVTAGGGTSDWVTLTQTVGAPLPPLNFRVVPGSVTTTQIGLAWDFLSGVTQYKLERLASANASSGTALTLSKPTALGYTDTGLTNNTTYYFRLAAGNASGFSAWVVVNGTTGGLASPTLQPPVLGANRSVQLSWTAVSGATSYTLERFPGPDTTTAPTTVTLPTPTSTSVTDTAPADGVFTYRVRASNGTANSLSNLQTVTVGTVSPPAPTNFTATPTNSVTVNLSWTASSGATGYTVERGDGNAPTTWTPIANPTATNYSDTTARPLATHTYRLKANNAGSSSPWVTKTLTMGSPTLEVIAKGVDMAWSINFAPDGRLLFTPRNQTTLQVRMIRPSTFTGTPFNSFTTYSSAIPVRVESEAGILGMDLDPNFATNNRVYICYSYTSGTTKYNRVSRLEISGSSLINELKVLDAIPGDLHHNGCRVVVVGNYLFATMGDLFDAPSAQIVDGGKGRIFRMHLDGTIPVSNPFSSTATTTVGKATWNYGLRNSQGLQLQPGTNLLWSNEHGNNTRDEMNVFSTTIGGKNYGWPNCAGVQAFGTTINSATDGVYDCKTSASATLTAGNYVPATQEYEGGENPTIAPSDLVFYPSTATAFTAWQNNLLFVTLKTGRLYRLTLEGSTITNGKGEIILNPATIDGASQRLRDIAVGPDGFIYISTDQGNIFRLKP